MEQILRWLPALSSHPRALQFRGLLEAALFTTHREWGTGRTVLPYWRVAQAVGVNPAHHSFNAGEWIDAFSADVTDLNPTEPSYLDCRARTVSINPPSDIEAAVHDDLANLARGTDRNWVYLKSCLPVTRRSKKADQHSYHSSCAQRASQRPDDHPARPVIDYFAGLHGRVPQRIIRANIDRVVDLALAANSAQSRYALSILAGLRDGFVPAYVATQNSPRAYAIGASPESLPRHLRRSLFRGCVEFDLRAAQLGVIASRWSLPLIAQRLEREQSIWEQVLSEAGVGMTYKPTLKRATYALTFGMSQRHARSLLAHGNPIDEEPGLGDQAANHIWNQDWLQELLAGRADRIQTIKREGAITDAYGRFLTTEDVADHASGARNPALTLMAYEVQSFEMQLMSEALPILTSERAAHLISWLHDGITVAFGDCREKERQIKRIRQGVNRRAMEMGIPTQLEVERL